MLTIASLRHTGSVVDVISSRPTSRLAPPGLYLIFLQAIFLIKFSLQINSKFCTLILTLLSTGLKILVLRKYLITVSYRKNIY